MKKTKNERDFYYKKDRMNQLRGFCAVAQTGSVNRAKDLLNIEGTAVSKRVISLERDLGVKLFKRSTTGKKSLTLTTEGRRFYEKVAPQLQAIDGLFHEFIKSNDEKYHNTLRIATFDAIIERMLPYLIDFQKKNPKVDIQLFNISESAALKKLINNELDIVIYPSDENNECPIELEKRKIIINPSYLVLYKGHPLASISERNITKEMLAIYPIGLFLASDEDGLYSKAFADFTKDYKIKPPINIRYTSTSLIKKLVREKICITYFDEFWLNEEDRREFILKKDYIFPPMYFYAFKRKNTPIKAVTTKFMVIIEENKDKIFI